MCEPASEYKTALPRCGRAVLRSSGKAAGSIAQMLHICRADSVVRPYRMQKNADVGG